MNERYVIAQIRHSEATVHYLSEFRDPVGPDVLKWAPRVNAADLFDTERSARRIFHRLVYPDWGRHQIHDLQVLFCTGDVLQLRCWHAEGEISIVTDYVISPESTLSRTSVWDPTQEPDGLDYGHVPKDYLSPLWQPVGRVKAAQRWHESIGPNLRHIWYHFTPVQRAVLALNASSVTPVQLIR